MTILLPSPPACSAVIGDTVCVINECISAHYCGKQMRKCHPGLSEGGWSRSSQRKLPGGMGGDRELASKCEAMIVGLVRFRAGMLSEAEGAG